MPKETKVKSNTYQKLYKKKETYKKKAKNFMKENTKLEEEVGMLKEKLEEEHQVADMPEEDVEKQVALYKELKQVFQKKLKVFTLWEKQVADFVVESDSGSDSE